MKSNKELMDSVINIILILLGMFIAYQLLRKVFGGSWQFESIVISFLVFNLGALWKVNSNLWRLNAKLEGHIGWHKGKDNR